MIKIKIAPQQAKEWPLPDDIRQQLRHIATLLPATCEEYNITTEKTGLELQNAGVFEVKKNGLIQPVEIAGIYDIPGVALRDVNHEHKLRKFYRTNGILGVHQYLNQIGEYVAVMQGQYPSLWKDGTYVGVKEGTQLQIDPTYLEKAAAFHAIQSHIQQQ